MPAEQAVKVLLIEDDESVALMYRLKLEHDGYQVDVASDGESGLAKCLATNPDLIFLDIRLPRMDGFTVLERLRSYDATRYTPVVILSAYGEPELRDRGLRLGALEYVIKSQTTPAMVSGRVRHWTSTAELESAEPSTPAE